MNRSFLKYIGCAFAVLAGVAVVDKVAGAGMNRLLDVVPVTQDIGKGRFAIREVETDVVIVGSSRAAHHYVSTMIADSLGCSVYNVGRDGCGFSDNLCIANSILERYSPKMIILEVSSSYLGEGKKVWSEPLFPYYWKSDYIKGVVDKEIGWKSHIQMYSTLYRYNATSFRTLGYGFKGLFRKEIEDFDYGYTPLPYIKRRTHLQLKKEGDYRFVLSDWKYNLFKDFLLKASSQNVKIILVISPIFSEPHYRAGCTVLQDLCKETGVEFLDFASEPIFLEHPEWFNDNEHMNCNGTREYMRIFIRKILQNNI